MSVVFIAGCLGAAQIGKVAAGLSVLISELDLTLFQGGLVVSVFTLTTALTGVAFGIAGDRFGHLRLAVAGLSISAVGAFCGATSTAIGILLVTRVIEGLGFTMAIVCLPPLISSASSDRDRPLTMGLWGAFMPAGMGIAMVVSPWFLDHSGWRGQWNFVGLTLLVWAMVLFMSCRESGETHSSRRIPMKAVSVLRAGPLLLGASFGFYSALYVQLTAFFTTLLVNQKNISLDVAARFGALVVVANVIGNLAAGWLIRRGHTAPLLLSVAFVIMGFTGVMVFLSITPVFMKVAAGILFSAFGGMIPGTLFIMAPGFAHHPAQIAALSGLLLQGAGIGQTLGPLFLTSSIDYFGGWGFAGINMIITAIAGVLMAVLLARLWRIR